MSAALLVLGSLLMTQAPGCPIHDFRKVPPDAFGAQTWNALYRSFRKYEACDRGGEPSYSYDEDVIRLLVHRWQDFHEAASLFRKSPAFLRFVEKHVDAVALEGDLHAVGANARERCPEGMGKVCERLTARVKAALDEQAAVRVDAARHVQQ